MLLVVATHNRNYMPMPHVFGLREASFSTRRYKTNSSIFKDVMHIRRFMRAVNLRV